MSPLDSLGGNEAVMASAASSMVAAWLITLARAKGIEEAAEPARATLDFCLAQLRPADLSRLIEAAEIVAARAREIYQ